MIPIYFILKYNSKITIKCIDKKYNDWGINTFIKNKIIEYLNFKFLFIMKNKILHWKINDKGLVYIVGGYVLYGYIFECELWLNKKWIILVWIVVYIFVWFWIFCVSIYILQLIS